MDNNTDSLNNNIICKNCQEPFPARQSKPTAKDKLLFCSLSCAGTYNNRVRFPDRITVCAHCSENPRDKKSKYCITCRETKAYSVSRFTAYDSTLAELKEKYSTLQYHAKIRGYARSVYFSRQKVKSCLICGYSKHVDVCHVRDIKDFSLDAKLSEVNHPDNLVALCKNHHWEFDNKQLSEEDQSKLPF